MTHPREDEREKATTDDIEKMLPTIKTALNKLLRDIALSHNCCILSADFNLSVSVSHIAKLEDDDDAPAGDDQ